MKYSYRYKEGRPGGMNAARSMEMDPLRAQMAPTATQVRERAVAALAAMNGTSHVLPSKVRDERAGSGADGTG